jgi:hypothetical protein
VRQPYSYSVPNPHRLFQNSSTGMVSFDLSLLAPLAEVIQPAPAVGETEYTCTENRVKEYTRGGGSESGRQMVLFSTACSVGTFIADSDTLKYTHQHRNKYNENPFALMRLAENKLSPRGTQN